MTDPGHVYFSVSSLWAERGNDINHNSDHKYGQQAVFIVEYSSSAVLKYF